MQQAGSFIQIGLFVWLSAFVALVVFRLLSRQISTTGLLRNSVKGKLAPERVQMLIGIVAASAAYAGIALAADPGTKSLPPVPGWIVSAFGGSQLLFLFGKISDQVNSIQRDGGA